MVRDQSPPSVEVTKGDKGLLFGVSPSGKDWLIVHGYLEPGKALNTRAVMVAVRSAIDAQLRRERAGG